MNTNIKQAPIKRPDYSRCFFVLKSATETIHHTWGFPVGYSNENLAVFTCLDALERFLHTFGSSVELELFSQEPDTPLKTRQMYIDCIEPVDSSTDMEMLKMRITGRG